MLTKAFNCPDCKKPFDCKNHRRYYPPDMRRALCRTCITGPDALPQLGLVEFLSQPAFKRTDEGYEYTLPINDPICIACNGKIKVSEGAFLARCSHYLCKECQDMVISGRLLVCPTCAVSLNIYNHPNFLLADKKLTAFFDEIPASARECETKTLLNKGAQKECGDCGIERPVERLFKCNDCQLINCGNCFFDSHQGHDVVKLLGIELDKMEGQHSQRYTETLEGLRGNVQYVQKNIDNAVDKVLIAGRQRLAKIKECTQYQRASKIAEKVEKAAEDFEKECEVYFPVARKFATRLEELEEELMEVEE